MPANSSATNEYRAPTAGLEDMVFTIGKTKDADRFEVVKEELGKHFATQSWSDAADAARAFEILVEPVYTDPEEPDLPNRILPEKKVTSTDAAGLVTETIVPGEVDPEYESKSQRYQMLIGRYARDRDKWESSVKHLKDNKSRMFAILLQHCPKYPMQRLKFNIKYHAGNDKKDAITLVTMIRDVTHAHNDTT